MNLPHLHWKLGRSTACVLVVVVFFAAYTLQLFNWQIINGEAYEQEALSHRTDVVEIEAARGEILDREGNVLAGNHIVYEVIYNALYLEDSKRNETILQVMDLLEELGESWRDRLPIELDEEGNYRFMENKEDEIETLKSRDMLNLADYATADDCMRELARRYRYEGHSKEDTRTVLSVRYSMTRDQFSINDPYVFASGVSPETVGVFGEQSNRWKGIETRVNVDRYYGEEGSLAPHVVGVTGSMPTWFKEEQEEQNNLYNPEENIGGYKDSDVVGLNGAEYAFEAELRGQRGQQSVFSNEAGEVTTTATAIAPQEGRTVRLTLDADLQRVANWSLEKNIRANVNTGLKGDKKAHDCKAGAAVAIDISDFAVLAASSYPSYDLNLYMAGGQYQEDLLLDKDGLKALNDRALNGIYTPGSVFKPLVATAGLQEGIIGAGSPVYDCDGPGLTGVFKYADLELACTDKHGWASVYSAIAGSCNCYFCELGLRLGIDRLDAYAEYFGLGWKTGVELSEASGVMTSPSEYRERHSESGVDWTEGNTAQAAIGQSDNQFTPIQLATYCATLANGGRRYRTHFLSEVLDYTGKETIRRYEPELLYDAEIREDVQGVVRNAMIQTATSGTASSVFSDYPVTVACKTGTAETSGLSWEDGGTEEHISFICYAPAENPQIAIAVMLEHGSSGPFAMNVAKDMLDQYFGFYSWDKEGNRYNQSGDLVDDQGKVLKTKEDLDKEAAASAEPSADPEPAGEEDPEEEPSPTPEPTPTPAPERGSDIPDHIFTGGSPSSAPEEGEEGAPRPSTSPTPAPDSPFYYGKKPGEDPEPTPSPEPASGGEESGESGGEGEEPA